MRLNYSCELTTPRGIAFASVDAVLDVELTAYGTPSINAVFVDGENLFDGETLHRSIACAIAGEAENSKKVLAALEDEAYEEWAERKMVRA